MGRIRLPVSRDSISPELKENFHNAFKIRWENGLYGLDVKETSDGFKVIEINDNPKHI